MRIRRTNFMDVPRDAAKTGKISIRYVKHIAGMEYKEDIVTISYLDSTTDSADFILEAIAYLLQFASYTWILE